MKAGMNRAAPHRQMGKILFAVTGVLILFAAVLCGPADTRAEGGGRKWAFKTGGAVISSPSIDAEGTIYVGSNDGSLYAITRDGRLKWIFLTKGAVQSRPAIDSDGTIYVGSWDHHLYALRPDGSLKWKFQTNGPVSSSPVIGPERIIYICSHDHFVYAIDPEGSLKWKFPTKGEIFSSPVIGPDGTVYVGSWDSNVYAISGTSRNVSESPGIQKKDPDRRSESVVKTRPSILEDVRFETTRKGEDKVTFFISEQDPPRVFALGGNRPRLVCDFEGASPGRRIRPEKAVKGNVVRKIRMAFHKRPKIKTRIALDLTPGKKYEVEKKIFQEEHTFVLLIRPANHRQR